MRLAPDTAPRPQGDVLPMINVAFLLLIFFLLMARLAPPDPLDVAPPLAAGEAGERYAVLFVDAEGRLAFEASRGDAALAAAAAATDGAPLVIRADAALDAAEFAHLLARLSKAGVTDLRLATVTR